MSTRTRTFSDPAKAAAMAAAKERARQKALEAAKIAQANIAAQRAAMQPAVPTSGGMTLPVIGQVTPAKLAIGGGVLLGVILLVSRLRK